jgi:hypothetical protein
MPMQKILFAAALITCLMSCGNINKVPDTSQISVHVNIDRFDKAFFSIDTNNIAKGLLQLNQQFPYFLSDFTVNILGTGPSSDSNNALLAVTHQFLTSYMAVKDSIELQFENMDWLENQLIASFKLLKYYFPAYQLPPKVVTYIGPFDAPGVAITRYTLAIGLQLYAGADFTFYTSVQGQELYPRYISRRFEKPYISVNCMKALEEDLYPDSSAGKSLIEQMIQKGKYWWLADRLLPETPDSLKTGYTQKQLAWCKGNEGMIWNYILQNNDIYTVDPDLIKTYIGDAPNTDGMPETSPGNIGQWVGWQIINKYVENHSSISPSELMKTEAKKIFEESKYKPR